MSQQSILDSFKSQSGEATSDSARAFIANVFSYMFAALIISGVVAWLVGGNAATFEHLYFNQETGRLNPLYYVFMFAPLVFILAISFGLRKFSFPVVLVLFLGYAITMGMSLGFVFYIYQLGSIFKVFLISASLFGFMAVLGYTTKTDLTKFGAFLYMALFGLIVAMLVNWIWPSEGGRWWISLIGVLIFTGLTAYDMQKIKNMSREVEMGTESAGKMAIIGSLELYLDFINIFLFLLRLMGDRK